MVRGTTRQVLVVKGGDTALFEQAIFLVRDRALEQGGVTEETLLREARAVCAQEKPLRWKNALWSLTGAGATAAVWLITALLQ